MRKKPYGIVFDKTKEDNWSWYFDNKFLHRKSLLNYILKIKKKYWKMLLDVRVVLHKKGIYFKLIFVSNTICLIVNFSDHQHIFYKTILILLLFRIYINYLLN